MQVKQQKLPNLSEQHILKSDKADAAGSWAVKCVHAGIESQSAIDYSLFSSEAAKLRAMRCLMKEEAKLCLQANMEWRQGSHVYLYA